MKAGFYRLYGKDKVASLDEAIALAKSEATERGFDPDTFEVNRERTGIGLNGLFNVALLGRTVASLERENKRERARKGEET